MSEKTPAEGINKAASAASVRIYEDGTVTVADAARLLGVSYNTIRHWIKGGMPVAIPGARGKGSPARVLMKDILDHKMSESFSENFEGKDGETYNLEKSKARLAHVKADIEQAKRDRLFGEIVYVKDVAEVVETDYANIRAGVMNLPARVAVKASAMSDSREVYDYIKGECIEILEELSKPEDVGPRAAEKSFIGDEPEEDDEGEDE